MNFLHAMGAKVIGCSEQSGSIQGLDKPILGDAKPCFSDEEWQRVAEGYNTLGRLAAEKGMQVCLHHHMGTGIQTTAEIDKFMSLVDERVFLLFDTGHAWYSEGGEAPMLAILKKYLPRINHVHLKDVRPPVIDQVRRDGLSFLDGVKKGTFTVPGDGVIDFRPVFKLLDDFGYKGWMVGWKPSRILPGQSFRIRRQSAQIYSRNGRDLIVVTFQAIPGMACFFPFSTGLGA